MHTSSNFQIKEPSHGEAMRILARALGRSKAKAAWKKACMALDLPCHEEIEDQNDLYKIFKYLANEDDLVGVTGMSLYIRQMTFLNLMSNKEQARMWAQKKEADLRAWEASPSNAVGYK